MPKWFQNRSKIDQQSITHPCIVLTPHLDHLLFTFWSSSWRSEPPKTVKNLRYFNDFAYSALQQVGYSLIRTLLQNFSILASKISKNFIKIYGKTTSHSIFNKKTKIFKKRAPKSLQKGDGISGKTLLGAPLEPQAAFRFKKVNPQRPQSGPRDRKMNKKWYPKCKKWCLKPPSEGIFTKLFQSLCAPSQSGTLM